MDQLLADSNINVSLSHSFLTIHAHTGSVEDSAIIREGVTKQSDFLVSEAPDVKPRIYKFAVEAKKQEESSCPQQPHDYRRKKKISPAFL